MMPRDLHALPLCRNDSSWWNAEGHGSIMEASRKPKCIEIMSWLLSYLKFPKIFGSCRNLCYGWIDLILRWLLQEIPIATRISYSCKNKIQIVALRPPIKIKC